MIVHRHQLLWNKFGRIQQIERKFEFIFFLRNQLHAEFPLGEVASFSIASQRSRRWKVGDPCPPSILGLLPSKSRECTPSTGFQCSFTNVALALARSRSGRCERRSLPSCAGCAECERSLMIHISMWVLSGISETKSQNVSCADCACGISRSGSLLDGVDQVREFHRVLDEEDRHVVAYQVPIAFCACRTSRQSREHHAPRRLEPRRCRPRSRSVRRRASFRRRGSCRNASAW